MIVKEMIEKLREMPQDARVEIPTDKYEYQRTFQFSEEAKTIKYFKNNYGLPGCVLITNLGFREGNENDS